jgi:hypothetical protein
MDSNTTITVADPLSSRPDAQAETGSSPMVAGSSPQSRASRNIGESPATDEREAAELGSIEARLIAKYGPSLGPDAVTRCIAHAVGHFEGARIRNYMMLLVERRATEQLREEARRAAEDAGDGTVRTSRETGHTSGPV